MQGDHKPFSHVTLSFSPLHYLIYSQFCLIWTLLLYIWKTDEIAWLFVYVSLNLVTFVFDLTTMYTMGVAGWGLRARGSDNEGMTVHRS